MDGHGRPKGIFSLNSITSFVIFLEYIELLSSAVYFTYGVCFHTFPLENTLNTAALKYRQTGHVFVTMLMILA
jgi:hypothetical protein